MNVFDELLYSMPVDKQEEFYKLHDEGGESREILAELAATLISELNNKVNKLENGEIQ